MDAQYNQQTCKAWWILRTGLTSTWNTKKFRDLSTSCIKKTCRLSRWALEPSHPFPACSGVPQGLLIGLLLFLLSKTCCLQTIWRSSGESVTCCEKCQVTSMVYGKAWHCCLTSLNFVHQVANSHRLSSQYRRPSPRKRQGLARSGNLVWWRLFQGLSPQAYQWKRKTVSRVCWLKHSAYIRDPNSLKLDSLFWNSGRISENAKLLIWWSFCKAWATIWLCDRRRVAGMIFLAWYVKGEVLRGTIDKNVPRHTSDKDALKRISRLQKWTIHWQ